MKWSIDSKFQPSIFGGYTRAKLTCHLKMDHFSRKIVFQRAYFRGYVRFSRRITGDGSEILHQLRLVVYPIIYRVSNLSINGGNLVPPWYESWCPSRYARQEYIPEILRMDTKNGIFLYNHHFGCHFCDILWYFSTNHHFPTIILGIQLLVFKGVGSGIPTSINPKATHLPRLHPWDAVSHLSNSESPFLRPICF